MIKLTEQQLNAMAEAYFEGTLSEQEETLLREQLAASTIDTGSIGEAKAVMGFFATMRKQSRRKTISIRHPRRVGLISAVAASIAVLLIATWSYSASRRSDCVMYANGQVITSEEAVMATMNSQMADMKSPSMNISSIVQSQLGDFGELIDNK